MRRPLLLAAIALSSLPLAIAHAAEPETLLGGLDNPCGVAVQPETGVVFVSESGAGRVVRVIDGKAEDVLVGFPMDVYGEGPNYNIGPLGLLFLDKDTLVVGGGGQVDGEELLRVYKVPAPSAAAKQAAEMEASFKLAATDQIPGEGNFYALAATKTAIYVTCNGDDAKGWVAKADVSGTKVGPLQRFIATKEVTHVDAPVSVTISPHGHVLIGQLGELDVANDALLTFYHARTGKMLSNFRANLSDITALAYNAKGTRLYALDFAWAATDEGGLFALESVVREGETPSVKAVKLASLDKPTAMAFGPEGTLYVTVIGTVAEGGGKAGKLIQFTSGL